MHPASPAACRAQIASQLAGMAISRFRISSERAMPIAFDLADNFTLTPDASGKPILAHKAGLDIMEVLATAARESISIATAADLPKREPQPA
jgi:hypothetical protein